ncbi:hypothetical protein HMPREF0208_04646 [Citrobacter koseri]|nr:hypothetical protein HMPREF3220_04637 [Citrobacter koseri]KWZ98657.1 hypothetical protein HMPREF3207_03992 [Citrobacter koseri]KXB39818.1 hypothetical protein HMPREF0208_04646 [Citrobacter koseri]
MAGSHVLIACRGNPAFFNPLSGCVKRAESVFFVIFTAFLLTPVIIFYRCLTLQT